MIPPTARLLTPFLPFTEEPKLSWAWDFHEHLFVLDYFISWLLFSVNAIKQILGHFGPLLTKFGLTEHFWKNLALSLSLHLLIQKTIMNQVKGISKTKILVTNSCFQDVGSCNDSCFPFHITWVQQNTTVHSKHFIPYWFTYQSLTMVWVEMGGKNTPLFKILKKCRGWIIHGPVMK